MNIMKSHRLFGITITDTTRPSVLKSMEKIIKNFENRPTTIFFVNTHTLNLAISDANYTKIIDSADYVFGDGTGVRWAFRIIKKIHLEDNVNGTDLIPEFLIATANKKYRCFLLGATPEEIEVAASHINTNYQKWQVADFHHGYFEPEDNQKIIKQINKSGAELLLVGMGNPLQEQWISENKDKLNIPIVIGVGGLFTYWAGNLDRAPLWMRKLGIEWIHILRRQPKKWQRYIFGNLLFLFRIFKESFKKQD